MSNEEAENRLDKLRSQINRGTFSSSNIKARERERLVFIAKLGKDAWNLWFQEHPPEKTLDFSGADFRRERINFSGFIFKRPIDGSPCVDFTDAQLKEANKFKGSRFETKAIFTRTTTGNSCSFKGAIFEGDAEFKNSNFGENTNFERSTFEGNADFSEAQFDKDTNFNDSKFCSRAKYNSTIFGKSTRFNNCRFEEAADFSQASFGNLTEFKITNFFGESNFDQTTFGIRCSFEKASFHDEASFLNTEFQGGADFKESCFSDALFDNAEFTGIALFISTKFSGLSLFRKSLFHTEASFEESEFQSDVIFTSARFNGPTSFDRSIFNGTTTFKGTSHQSSTSFEFSKFHRVTDFSITSDISKSDKNDPLDFNIISFAGAHFQSDVTFEGRKFKSKTDFGRSKGLRTGSIATTFDGIPNFHGCDLHQDTDFNGTIFNEDFDADRGPDAARAYRTLKLAMEKVKATREEQRFFRLEMKAEHPSLPRGKRWISTLYGLFSDYGFSLWRPAVWLLGLSILFGIGYGALANACAANTECSKIAWTGNTGSSEDRTSAVIKYTLASVAPVPGLDKMQTELRAPIFGHHGWVPITALILEIFHKIAALVMAFLFALALRNLFKMKS